jgi:hypothetical protein
VPPASGIDRGRKTVSDTFVEGPRSSGRHPGGCTLKLVIAVMIALSIV